MALALVLPSRRARRAVAVLLGVGLGAAHGGCGSSTWASPRPSADPFNPVIDWTYLGSAVGLLSDSIGRPGAVGARCRCRCPRGRRCSSLLPLACSA